MKMPRPFRLPRWARWVAAWMAAVFFLVVGGSVTLLMSQSSGCTTTSFQISGPSAFTALAQSFTLSWSKTPSTPSCASIALVQDGVTWLTPPLVTASGSNGSATYTMQANTGSTRTATILVGSTSLENGNTGTAFQDGTTFTVTQSAAVASPATTIYYSAFSPAQLWSLNLATRQTTLIDSSPSEDTPLSGLLFDPQGRIVYTEPFSIRAYNPTTFADTLLASGFAFLTAIALDPSGTSVLAADFAGGSIYRISLSTGTAMTLGSAGAFLSPTGLAYDSQGNLYAIIGDNQIEQINPTTGAVIKTGPLVGICSSGCSLPSLTYDSFSNKLWAADDVNNCIHSFDLATLTPSACVGGGIFSGPGGIAADGAGNIFVASNAISVVVSYLLSYNITTGAITQVSNALSNGINGLAPLSGLGAPPGSASTCTFALNQLIPSNFPASGGTGSVTLSVTGGSGSCPVGPSFSSSFILIGTVPSSLGSGASVTVNFTVAPNNSTSTLTGTMTIAGQTVTITESGAASSCSVTLSQTSIDVSDTASFSGSFTVTAPSGCAWTAVSNASFLTVTAGASGTGNGTVTYSVNGSGSATTGTISVKTSTSTANFTLNLVAATAVISSVSPSSSCSPPASQKYFLQNSSVTLYAWFASTPGSSSDQVGANVVYFPNGTGAGTIIGTTTFLQAATGCFFAPITLSAPSPGLYEVIFSLNLLTAGNPQFTIVGNQVSVGASGTLSPLPGPNQENVAVTQPNALPDAATLTLNQTFSPSGVVNAASSPGAYDCRFVPQSGSNVTIPAGQTQSPASTFSGGTVAGTCSIGVSNVSLPGLNFEPPLNSVSITNTPSSSNTPNIANGVSQTSAAANATLTLQVTGYSMTRDLSLITFAFSPASGFTIGSSTVTANVQSQAVTWYTSAGSAATGGQFQYSQSFNIGSGTSADLNSVTVTVTSTTGTSPPVTISLH
jgi:hypothetical protein